jgi:D-alanyl-D-alanine carboxypeptidase
MAQLGRRAVITWAIFGAAVCAAPAIPQSDPRATRLPLDAAMAELATLPPPGASLGIVRHGRARFRNIGAEAVGRRGDVSEATIFQIASLTKPFTAIVILRLAEEGRLSLDERARATLTWLPERYEAVTIRQLLNHTSGVPRDLRRENVDEFPSSEIRTRLLAAEASFAPGTQWEYSNTGYILLSLIAEQKTGRPFGELLHHYIFEPLGMDASDYRAPLLAAPGRAAGNDLVEGAWQPAPPVYSGFGNSGIETNARDLARFAAALQQRRLLRPESYAAMLAPGRLANGEAVTFPFRGQPSSYGLGWFLTRMCGRQVALHGGTIAGYSSALYWAVEGDVSTLALSNGKARPDRTAIAEWPALAALRQALNCPAPLSRRPGLESLSRERHQAFGAGLDLAS